MTDYISREAAIELLSQPITMSMCLSTEECHHKIAQQRIDRYLIEDIPAADVRPVVLCGECKFWGRERISCEGLARCNTGESGVRYRNRNDFCSRGEKREER